MNYRIVLLLLVTTCWSIPEKKMVLVMPSYNNAQWYQMNLDSVFNQTYKNWHIIYIDDVSTDGTSELVWQYVIEKGMVDKVTLITNKQKKGALANHYRAVHMCDDWDIIVQLDGDDWFAHNDVLKELNEIYEDENIWLTYGSFIDWPNDKIGYCKPVAQEVVEKKLYRETHWTPGQLRTFYAWLFKNIKLEDFLWDHSDDYYGKFYPASCDLAFAYPLMEMAGAHFKFMSDINYIHNVATQLNDCKVNRIPQIIASNVLLHKKKYERLDNAPEKKVKVRANAKKVDVIVFNVDRNVSPEPLLQSCKTLIQGIHKLFFVDISTCSITEYDSLRAPVVRTYDSLKLLFLKELHNWWKSSEYVLFLDSRMNIVSSFDVIPYLTKMEQTQAYAYFPALSVASNIQQAPYAMLDDEVCAWRLCYSDHQWMSGASYFNVVMHKKVIRDRITYLDDELIKNSLLKNLFAPGMLMIQDTNITRIGLCGIQQKVV